jgi:hypothetical protein
VKSIIEYGRTANMGNFESLRVAKTLEVTAKTDEELESLCDEAYEICKSWVEKKIQHEMKTKRPERK